MNRYVNRNISRNKMYFTSHNTASLFSSHVYITSEPTQCQHGRLLHKLQSTTLITPHTTIQYQNTTTHKSRQITNKIYNQQYKQFSSDLSDDKQSKSDSHNTDDSSKSKTDDLSPKSTALENNEASHQNDIEQSDQPDTAASDTISGTNTAADASLVNELQPRIVSNKYTAASPTSTESISSQNASLPVVSQSTTNHTHDNTASSTDGNKDPPSESTAVNSPAPASEIRGLLWFDNLYPMRAAYIDFRHYLVTHNHESTIPKIMSHACEHVEISEMIPRIKEGGVFVRFKTRHTDQYPSAESVAESIIKELKDHPRRALLTPQPVHVHLGMHDTAMTYIIYHSVTVYDVY